MHRLRYPVTEATRWGLWRVVAPVALILTVGTGRAETPKPLDTWLAAQLPSGATLCALAGDVPEGLTGALARGSHLIVEVWSNDLAVVHRERQVLVEAGLYGQRAVAGVLTGPELPYVSGLVDCVAYFLPGKVGQGKISAPELLRVLRPEGVALVIGAEGRELDTIGEWSSDAVGAGVTFPKGLPRPVVRLTKGRDPGTDEWTHWQHLPDNNPISRDRTVRAPYRTQFLSTPWFTTVPSVSVIAGGRLFRAAGHLSTHDRERPYLNTLTVTNAHNGLPLWTRPLPEGYLTHRSLFVATADTFYLVAGREVLKLDPATGAVRGRLTPPEATSAEATWKWIALQDGVLYGLLGLQEFDPAQVARNRRRGATSWTQLSGGAAPDDSLPWGAGGEVVALDAKAGTVRWRYESAAPLASRSLCMNADRLFFHCERVRIGALSLSDGKLVWENTDPKLLTEVSTPFSQGSGFQTTPYTLCVDRALYFGGQGRRSVVALSAEEGHRLWSATGALNATNLIVSGGFLAGHTPSCTMLDLTTGEVRREPNLNKLSCARMTGTPFELFYRGSFVEDKKGEGTVWYDVASGKAEVSHAFRPPCNDGLIPAEGLLHATQWDCDTDMQLVGALALAPAGNEGAALGEPGVLVERGTAAPGEVKSLPVAPGDWPTYRGDNLRSSSTPAAVGADLNRAWSWSPKTSVRPTAPVAAGGLVFFGGDGGVVRAVDARTGRLVWQEATAGAVRQAPTIDHDRAYFGSADGCVYCLEAATGRFLWRVRIAPAERRLMAYGSGSSTWPVNSGVLIHDGTAYAAAGLLNHDGTYVAALDAITGERRWVNSTSGRLSETGQGVSVQGDLTVVGGRLWLAGGNSVSPAAYDLRDGRFLGTAPPRAAPSAPRGREVIGFLDRYVMVGGPRLFTQEDSSLLSWQSPFEIFSPADTGTKSPARFRAHVPPAFGHGIVVIAGSGPLVCLDSRDTDDWLKDAKTAARRVRWTSKAVVQCRGLGVAKEAVVAVGKRSPEAARPWFLVTLEAADGAERAAVQLPKAPLLGGVCLLREGGVVVTFEDGTVARFGQGK